MSKSFVVDRVNGDKPLENDSVVTVYDSLDDAELDLANIEEGQIVGTNDNVGTEAIENAIKADLDEYAENLMQSYGQAVGSYLTMEDNSAIPQGYLLADGRDTTGTDDELLTKYPLLYAYLGNTNVLPYTPNTSIINKDPDWFKTNTDAYPGSAEQLPYTTADQPRLFPTEMPYDGFMQIHLDDWCYIHITHADGTHETYPIRRDDSWSDQVIYLKKGDKFNINRTVGNYTNWTLIQFCYVKIWYYKTLQYIKAVSGIETASTEASEVANAITVAEAALESKVDGISSSWVDVTSDFTLTNRDSWTNSDLNVYWNKYLRELRVYSKRTSTSAASVPHTFDITYNGTDTLIDFSSNTLMVDQSLRCNTYNSAHSGFEGFYTVISSNQIQLGGYNRNQSTVWPANATICARISL